MQHDRVDQIVPCAVQSRDVAIVRDVWRYRFLSAHQLFELWWPGRSPRAGQRRLSKLFDAGFLERFRPITRRGSFPWTYQLGAEGHRMLQYEGIIDHGVRYRRRTIYEYGRVLHDLQLNAWVLAYRRVADEAFLAWEGETDIDPPTATKRGQPRLEGDWSAKGLRDQQAKLVRPDAVLELEDHDDQQRTFLVEYDRTRRVDKNFGKFRRYDAFLNWWWPETRYGDREQPPFVLFVCQDEDQRRDFMAVADHDLTGHRWHPSIGPDEHEYVGRRHTLFVVEREMHERGCDAWRLPAVPPNHSGRVPEVRRVSLPARLVGSS
ncbi:MAG: replication-relaxation family protein [Solirubrobacteraceae bacterium]|nr:replication-relaxation family protein [Solirubrobacteraceae bacterium]